MTYKQTMVNMQGTANSIALKILTSSNKNDIFLLFEGKDDQIFYYPKAQKYLNKCIPIVASGKGNLLKIYNREVGIAKSLPFERICFFIDRDHDDFIKINYNQGKFLYVTEGYSIENTYQSVEFIEQFLRQNAFGEHEKTEEAVAFALDSWRIIHGQIETLMQDFMASVIIARITGIKMELDNFKLKKCILINNNLKCTISKNADVEFYDSVFLQPMSINREMYLEIINKLKMHPPIKWIRGKYFLELLFQYFIAVRQYMSLKGVNLKFQNYNAEEFIRTYNGQMLNIECLDKYFRDFIGKKATITENYRALKFINKISRNKFIKLIRQLF